MQCLAGPLEAKMRSFPHSGPGQWGSREGKGWVHRDIYHGAAALASLHSALTFPDENSESERL